MLDLSDFHCIVEDGLHIKYFNLIGFFFFCFTNRSLASKNVWTSWTVVFLLSIF